MSDVASEISVIITLFAATDLSLLKIWVISALLGFPDMAGDKDDELQAPGDEVLASDSKSKIVKILNFIWEMSNVKTLVPKATFLEARSCTKNFHRQIKVGILLLCRPTVEYSKIRGNLINFIAEERSFRFS